MRFGIRELIFMLVLLAVPAASYMYVFKPRNKDIEQAGSEIEAKQARLDELAAMVAHTDDLGLEIERGRKAIDVIHAKLPSRQEVEVILHQVSELASQNELVVKSVKTEKTEKAASYEELPLKIVIEGHFDGFYQFLLELEKLDRITRIHDMTLERLGDLGSSGGDAPPGSMKADFTLSIYFESTERETA